MPKTFSHFHRFFSSSCLELTSTKNKRCRTRNILNKKFMKWDEYKIVSKKSITTISCMFASLFVRFCYTFFLYFFSHHVLQFDGIILKVVLLLLPNVIIILTTKFTLSDFACIIFAFWIVSFWLIVKFRLLLFPWSYSSTYVSTEGEKKINLSEAHIIFIDFSSLSMFNDEKRRIRKKKESN